MQSFRETPTHQNRVDVTLAWSFFLAGAALFIAASYLPTAPALVQLVGVGLLAAAIVLTSRHQVRYEYRIEQDERSADEVWDLIVTEQKSKRRTVVCRLELRDLVEIDRQTPENRDELKKKYEKDTVHHYCVDLLPPNSAYLRFEEAGERIVIRLQASENLLQQLDEAMDQNRQE